MHDAVLVRVLEGVGDFSRDPHRFVHAELRLAVELRAQCLAVDERHDVEEEAVRGTRIEERENVRVLQRRRGLDLDDEPFGAEDGGELGLQHLQRDVAIMLYIVREVDRGHAAHAELALNGVTPGQRRVQLCYSVHRLECRSGSETRQRYDE